MFEQLKRAIAAHEVNLEKLLKNKEFTFANFVDPLCDTENDLNIIWGDIQNLYAVKNNRDSQDLYNESLPLMVKHGIKLTHNKKFYEAIKSIKNSPNFANLSVAQKTVIDHFLLSFELGGINLSKADQKKYAKLEQELSQLSAQFSQNVLDSTNAWQKLIVDERELKGLPEIALNRACDLAKKKGLKGYLLTLDQACVSQVMAHAENKNLRQEIYRASVTKASSVQKSPNGEYLRQFDNSKIMIKIMDYREQMASLLGFKNYSEYALKDKMAGTPEKVMAFLQDLLSASKEKAREEMLTIQKFAGENLTYFNSAYFVEKYAKEKLHLDDEKIREYFPLEKVIKGLFLVTKTLFEIDFVPNKHEETWDPSVLVFDVMRANQRIARCYFDLFIREDKQSGAWMHDQKTLWRDQKPEVYLNCNFMAPTKEKPSLLSLGEVSALFHEFGHTLQHILTTIDVYDVSGINGIPWDGVEIASQFFENFCLKPEVLKVLSEHYKTKEEIPDQMIEDIIKSRKFLLYSATIRQIEFALFDLRVHCEFDKTKRGQMQKILDEIRRETTFVKVPRFNRFQNSFSHIFAGGYASAYYSYKYSEVMSMDLFSRFKGNIFDSKEHQIHLDFLHKFLEKGGSENPEKLFFDFMGRTPRVEALFD